MKKFDPYILSGGLNTEDAQAKLKPGEARGGSVNFECVQGGGYRAGEGYERFSGKLSPSSQIYILYFTAGQLSIVAGEVLTGATSSATVLALTAPTVTSGSYGGSNAVGYVPVTVTTGTLQDGETLNATGPATFAVLDGVPDFLTSNVSGYKTILRAARTYLRGLIAAVPGSGSIIGVVNIATAINNVYAFRKNAGATAVDLYKKTSTGWVQVPMLHEIGFSAGSGTDVAEGTTLTRGANSAIIRSVTVTSGTFGAGTAAGTMCIDIPAPGNFTAGAATTPAGACTISGANQAIVLGTANTRSDFIVHNFTGDSTKRRIYGVFNSQFHSFEIRPLASPTNDHLVYNQIPGFNGTPARIAEHLGRLWVGFTGGSLQYSAANLPFSWSAVVGAGELAIGEEITGLRSLRSDALCVTGLNTVRVLSGTTLGSSDFRKLLDTTGCAPYTLNEINGATIGTDRIGTYFLEAGQEFGDFKKNALSRKVERMVAKRTQDIVFALVCKNKSQYRIYFNDKTGITATFDGTRMIGWFPFRLAHQFTCGWVGEDENGDEVMYAGTDQGYVMQLDTGTSYDGETIPRALALAFANQGGISAYKRYYTMRPDVQSEGGPVDIELRTDLDYGGTRGDSSDGTGVPATGSPLGSGTYGAGSYGTAVVGDASYEIDGIGFNISPIYIHEDDIDGPFTFEANTIEYAMTKARK